MPNSSPDSHAETNQRAAHLDTHRFLLTSGTCLPTERIARRSPMFVAAANDVGAVADPPVPQCKGLADKSYSTETAVLLPTPRTHPRGTVRPQQLSRHDAGPKSLGARCTHTTPPAQPFSNHPNQVTPPHTAS